MTAPRITPDHPAVIRDSQGNPLPPIPDGNGGELLLCWLDELPEGTGFRYSDTGRWWTTRAAERHFAAFVKADRSPKSDPDYMTPERSAMVDRAEAKQGER